jgi:hypothetical protein
MILTVTEPSVSKINFMLLNQLNNNPYTLLMPTIINKLTLIMLMISHSISELITTSTLVYSLTLLTCTKSLSEDGVINNLLLEKECKLLIKLLNLPLESVIMIMETNTESLTQTEPLPSSNITLNYKKNNSCNGPILILFQSLTLEVLPVGVLMVIGLMKTLEPLLFTMILDLSIDVKCITVWLKPKTNIELNIVQNTLQLLVSVHGLQINVNSPLLVKICTSKLKNSS